MPSYAQFACPHCGAPLPPPPTGGVVHCGFCARELVPSHLGWRLLSDEQLDPTVGDLDQPRVWLGPTRYALMGRLKEGSVSDVFLARRDSHVSERVVLKFLRKPEGVSALQNEWHVSTSLRDSPVKGAAHFSKLLPAPIACGKARLGVRGELGERRVWAYRYKSGFVHTLSDVGAEYKNAVPETAAVWIWKRMLEVLGFVHAAGLAHGNLSAEHALVHARDHGVALVGLGAAGAAPAAREQDLSRSAQLILTALGGTGTRPPSSVSDPIGTLLTEVAAGNRKGDPWQIAQVLSERARLTFGPPKYIPFAMPGWA